MSKEIYHHLKKNGFLKRGKVNEDLILDIPFAKLVDFLDKCTSETLKAVDLSIPSIHTHCATFGLGGGRDECWSLDCRMKAVDEMARFAAFYSDRVYIHNFLADYAPSWGHPPDQDNWDFRQDVIYDIKILSHLKPLIETNRVVLFSPPADVCPYCYAEKIYGKTADERLKLIMDRLEREFIEDLSVDIYLDEDGYCAAYKTKKGYFRHNTHIQSIDVLPDSIVSNQSLYRKITNGEIVTMSPDDSKDLGIHKDLIIQILTNIRYQMSVTEVSGASFLTDRDVDLRILSFISDDDRYEKRNRIASKYLKSMVPFVGDVPTSKLLKLREREEDSFLQFRSALDKAIEEFISQDDTFTDRDAKALYADVISPEVARLDKKVEEAKRDLVKVPISSAIGTVALLSFGYYSGMIPAELKEVASILGLTKVVYDTVTKAVDLLDVQKSIRPEKYYFLWRVLHSS